jgi:hypothetical protein
MPIHCYSTFVSIRNINWDVTTGAMDAEVLIFYLIIFLIVFMLTRIIIKIVRSR